MENLKREREISRGVRAEISPDKELTEFRRMINVILDFLHNFM